MFLRRLSSILLIASIAALVSTAQSKKFIYHELVKPKSATFYHVPIGLCEDYPEESTTPAKIRGDLETLKRTGTKFLRIAFGWDSIEEQQGTYNWLFWDDLVKMAVDEYGITLIPYICYTPRWNSTGDTTNFWNHTPKDYDAYGTFVGVLVNRYKDRIKSWELWNEPDIKEYWSGTAEDLAKLIKIGSQAVRKADPTALVVCPGLAYKTDFLLSLFRDHGVGPYVDVVNCHNYNETWGGEPIESIVPYVNKVAEVVKRYGQGQSIWMAEVGYSDFRKGAYVSNQYNAFYEYEHTADYQAIQLVKILTLLISTEKLAAIAWYRIEDLPSTQDVIGDVNNRHLGVVTTEFKSKPAEGAISFSHKLFSQKMKYLGGGVDVKRGKRSESQVYTFQNEDGSVIVVAWLKTHTDGKSAVSKEGNAKDARKETVSLVLPMELGGRAVQYDAVGNERTFASVQVKGGRTMVKDLPLQGGEIIILKLSK